MLLCGTYRVLDKLIKIYTKNWIEFWAKETDNEEKGLYQDAELFADWALILNSPWSVEKYDVRWARGIVSAGELSGLDCEKMCWMGALRSDTDGLSAECYGYAEDPVDALAMCIEKFKLIQSTFNPEDDSI